MSVVRDHWSEDETIEFLRSIGDMPRAREHKCRSLYQLAASVPQNGVIVELGTWLGYGSIALARGTLKEYEVNVHTYDTFTHRVGWAGEQYWRSDLQICNENYTKAGVRIIIHQMDIAEGAEDFKTFKLMKRKGVQLLYWDAGVKDCVEDHINAWESLVSPGGLIVLHDTSRFDLGVDRVIGKLVASDLYDNNGVYPGDLWVLQKVSI